LVHPKLAAASIEASPHELFKLGNQAEAAGWRGCLARSSDAHEKVASWPPSGARAGPLTPNQPRRPRWL